MGVSDMGHTFENFDLVQGTREAFEAFLSFAEGKTSKFMLLCYGGTGNGKTYLAEALCIRLTERNLFARYYLWARLVAQWKRMLRPNSIPNFDTVFNNFATAGRLVVDDYGGGTTDSTWETAQFEDLINERYRRGLLTVVCTNKDIKELPERVESRFLDREYAIAVLNRGQNYRLLKAKGK